MQVLLRLHGLEETASWLLHVLELEWEDSPVDMAVEKVSGIESVVVTQ